MLQVLKFDPFQSVRGRHTNLKNKKRHKERALSRYLEAPFKRKTPNAEKMIGKL